MTIPSFTLNSPPPSISQSLQSSAARPLHGVAPPVTNNSGEQTGSATGASVHSHPHSLQIALTEQMRSSSSAAGPSRPAGTEEAAATNHDAITPIGGNATGSATSTAITDIAVMIASSENPNLLRDQLIQNEVSAIASSSSGSRERPRNPYLRKANATERAAQITALNKADFSVLADLGKGTSQEDLELVRQIVKRINDLQGEFRKHVAHSAAAVTVEIDVLAYGLAVRLPSLKGERAQLAAAQFLNQKINDDSQITFGDESARPVGMSSAIRLKALDEMLSATRSTTSKSVQAELLQTTITALNKQWGFRFDDEDKMHIASTFCSAVPRFSLPTALIEFRAIVSGRPDKDGVLGSSVSWSCPDHVRATIAGNAAKSAFTPESVQDSVPHSALSKNLQSFRNVFIARVKGLTPTQDSMLEHMLDHFRLPDRKKDPGGLNIFNACENIPVWNGLLDAMSSLSKSGEPKADNSVGMLLSSPPDEIGNAFLKMVKKSRILELSSDQFEGMTLEDVRYRSAFLSSGKKMADKTQQAMANEGHLLPATPSLHACQKLFCEPYSVLERVLPEMRESKVTAELRKSLDLFKSLIPDDLLTTYFGRTPGEPAGTAV